MALLQSCAVLHNIARLENDPQPPDDIKNIKELLSNDLVEVETVTQLQRISPAHALRTALRTQHFAVL